MKGSLFKKGFAALASLAVGISGLALGVTAANAAVTLPTTTTVTLNATDEAQFTDHTYKVAKVADYAVTSGAAGVKTPAGNETTYRAALAAAGVTGVPTSGDPLEWAVENNKLDQSGTGNWLGNGTTRKFADYLAAHLTLTDLDASKVAGTGTSRTVDLGSVGLWLIVDQAPSQSSTKALPILVGTPWTKDNGLTEDLSAGTVEMKNQLPTVTKDVDNVTPSKGKDVTYTLDSKVPNYVGYRVKNYTYRLVDKFAAKDAPSKVYYTGEFPSVKIGDDTLTAGDYTVTYYTNEAMTTTTTDAKKAVAFRIDFSDYIQKQFTGTAVDDSVFYSEALAGKPVTVSYKVHVNADLSAGVVNTPGVEYSNKPGEENDRDKPGYNPGPEKKIFNFPVKIIKTDKTTGEKLADAEFEVTGTDGSKWTGTTNDKGELSLDGLGGIFLPDADAGNFSFSHTYTVKETKAPAGHVLPSDATFKFTISGTINGTGASATVTNLKYTLANGGGLQSFATVDSGKATITLQNAKNITQLPLTGAAGTAMFVTLGLVLAGAAFAVHTKSRSASRALRR
ncbi:SpaH/EbpB family LPXTG-anchored major pilin [Bifidobacterium sp. SMB2]|uniref:SpaH/EbpB family LPXTG-anchored major pilin n=1 Tax=Bifidobacterium saimiriisciurei TaxID=2661627 RepID=A0ABX0CB47_9BIFI|nr:MULTISPECIES: SpaH/EbpB family LPXTG-anchored major pilin [Bifidobacterium]NEG95479.1 SpaH/EbpB family LPXTG-anchored major pilin [Bifidobacterium sp. SMB2]NEH11637.1 SpaH/EbpB family LPXTG-anchored major pilin [Bifidobacterium saimiriisciurei]